MEASSKTGPVIAGIAALAGDPGRANMLVALVDGRALTASELAAEAGITAQTASAHLAKLEAGGLIAGLRQGRHRYFRLADGDVAHMLETMMGVAVRAGHKRTRQGPADNALRHARVCYDHLAGEMGVALFDALMRRGVLAQKAEAVRLTADGAQMLRKFGIDPQAPSRRPLCLTCLDWSMRRSHLAGRLGAELLDQIFARGWARRDKKSRAVLFTPKGERDFAKLLLG